MHDRDRRLIAITPNIAKRIRLSDVPGDARLLSVTAFNRYGTATPVAVDIPHRG